MKTIEVNRSAATLDPDRTHVLARPFRLMNNHRSPLCHWHRSWLQ
jgi:hypothetical protein